MIRASLDAEHSNLPSRHSPRRHGDGLPSTRRHSPLKTLDTETLCSCSLCSSTLLLLRSGATERSSRRVDELLLRLEQNTVILHIAISPYYLYQIASVVVVLG